MATAMLRCILLAALVVAVIGEAYPVDNDPIVWETASDAAEPRRDLNTQHIGECVCDVTRGLCDENCCCDPDCPAEVVDLFPMCEPQQYGYPSIKYCYDDNSATRLIKASSSAHVYLDKQPQGTSAICVIRTNAPKGLYRYFDVPTSTARPPPPVSNKIQPTSWIRYTVGSPLSLAKEVVVFGGRVALRSVGNWQMPVQLPDGQCSNLVREAAFLNPLQGVSCTLNGAQICSMLPVQRFTGLYLLPVNFNASAPQSFGVVVNVHNAANDLVGTITPTTEEYQGEFASTNTGTMCTNAVSRVTMEIFYDVTDASYIGRAQINVTVSDVPSTTFVPIIYETAFVQFGAALPASIISATPGFVSGGAIRGGTLVRDGENRAIVERKGGFAIPSGGRSCALGNFRTVGFMNSVLAGGCSVTVSETQLQDICTDGNRDLVQGVLNSTYRDGFPSMIDYVAMTNDALASDVSSWIPITGLDTMQFLPGVFDEIHRECREMVIGVSYQFVVARAGAEYNPQDVIIGAFAEPIIGSWRIRNATNLSVEATTSQYLLFRASFSRYDEGSQATIRRRVKAPPILPRLDDTIFYPFRRPYPL